MRQVLDDIVRATTKRIPDEVYTLPQYSGQVKELDKRYVAENMIGHKVSVVDMIKRGANFELEKGKNIIELPDETTMEVDEDTMKYLRALVAVSISDIPEVAHAIAEALYEYLGITANLAECEKTPLHDAIKEEILDDLSNVVSKK